MANKLILDNAEEFKVLTSANILKLYKKLKDKEAELKIKLDSLKKMAAKFAPELVSLKPDIKWDKANLDKLPEEFYKTVLNTGELNKIYNSAIGKSFVEEYGLSCQESVIVTWKPLKYSNKGAN